MVPQDIPRRALFVFPPISRQTTGTRLAAVIIFIGLVAGTSYAAPPDLPFEVANTAHKKWSPDEAVRIYEAACTLVARSVNVERPPHLHPRFLLVLGSDADEIVRTDNRAEIHLKVWDPDKFAEAATIMATRDLIQRTDIRSIARQSVVSAHATTSVTELRLGH